MKLGKGKWKVMGVPVTWETNLKHVSKKDSFLSGNRILVSNGHMYFTCNAIVKWIFFSPQNPWFCFWSATAIGVGKYILWSRMLVINRLALLLTILYSGFPFTDNRRPRGKEKIICAFFSWFLTSFPPSSTNHCLTELEGWTQSEATILPSDYPPKMLTLLKGLQNGTRVLGFLPKEQGTSFDSDSRWGVYLRYLDCI